MADQDWTPELYYEYLQTDRGAKSRGEAIRWTSEAYEAGDSSVRNIPGIKESLNHELYGVGPAAAYYGAQYGGAFIEPFTRGAEFLGYEKPQKELEKLQETFSPEPTTRAIGGLLGTLGGSIAPFIGLENIASRGLTPLIAKGLKLNLEAPTEIAAATIPKLARAERIRDLSSQALAGAGLGALEVPEDRSSGILWGGALGLGGAAAGRLIGRGLNKILNRPAKDFASNPEMQKAVAFVSRLRHQDETITWAKLKNASVADLDKEVTKLGGEPIDTTKFITPQDVDEIYRPPVKEEILPVPPDYNAPPRLRGLRDVKLQNEEIARLKAQTQFDNLWAEQDALNKIPEGPPPFREVPTKEIFPPSKVIEPIQEIPSIPETVLPIPKEPQVGGLRWDNQEGLGSIPNAFDAEQAGRMVKMTPDEFLNVVLKKETSEVTPALRSAVKEGKAVGTPYLNIGYDAKLKSFRIIGHEGRNRAQLAKELGESEIPVAVHISSEAKAKLRSEGLDVRDIQRKIIINERKSGKLSFKFGDRAIVDLKAKVKASAEKPIWLPAIKKGNKIYAGDAGATHTSVLEKYKLQKAKNLETGWVEAKTKKWTTKAPVKKSPEFKPLEIPEEIPQESPSVLETIPGEKTGEIKATPRTSGAEGDIFKTEPGVVKLKGKARRVFYIEDAKGKRVTDIYDDKGPLDLVITEKKAVSSQFKTSSTNLKFVEGITDAPLGKATDKNIRDLKKMSVRDYQGVTNKAGWGPLFEVPSDREARIKAALDIWTAELRPENRALDDLVAKLDKKKQKVAKEYIKNPNKPGVPKGSQELGKKSLEKLDPVNLEEDVKKSLKKVTKKLAKGRVEDVEKLISNLKAEREARIKDFSAAEAAEDLEMKKAITKDIRAITDNIRQLEEARDVLKTAKASKGFKEMIKRCP